MNDLNIVATGRTQSLPLLAQPPFGAGAIDSTRAVKGDIGRDFSAGEVRQCRLKLRAGHGIAGYWNTALGILDGLLAHLRLF